MYNPISLLPWLCSLILSQASWYLESVLREIPQKATGLTTTGILPPDKHVYGLAKGECCYPLTS